MSDLLAIGASGLRSYRAALDAIGDNVANANTEGYVRRSTRIAEVRVDSGPSLAYRNRVRFDGSEPADVFRATDAFRTQEARVTAADGARAASISGWLQTGETALGDRIGSSLSLAFSNGDRLAADPAGTQPRAAFLAGIGDVASEIRTSASELSRAADGIGGGADAEVAGANADLSDLASINLMIRRQQAGTAAFAELADQRDVLIDRLSIRLGVTANVSADGLSAIAVGGQTLLDLGTVTPVTAARASDGRIALAVGGVPLTPTSGSLAGLSNAAATIADLRVGLDNLAARIANAMNGWQAGGTTPDGRTGPPLLTIAAGAATLTLATNDPADVATASSSALNGNALALSDLRNTSDLEGGVATLLSSFASATAAARSDETATGKRRDIAAGARDQVEGVDLDHEAADLVRYQQAYQGAARVIQIAKQVVDDILALFR